MMNNKTIKAPWEEEKSPTMLVVHISAGELGGLDDLQGGPSLDEETGLREYSKLASVIEQPEIRELFKFVYADLEKDNKLSPPMQKAYQEAKDASLSYKDAPVEHTSPTKEIEKKGTAPDRHMAIIPENLALFFVELSHHVDINPETGLLQFGFGNFFRSVVRVAGTIGGAILGGPLGAAAGNMAARALTGQEPGMDMLMAGGKNALYAYGAQGLGQAAGLGTAGGAFGSGVGATGSTLGNMASQGLGAQSYGAYGSLMGKAAPAVTSAASVAGAAPTAAGTVAQTAGTAAPAASGWMDKLTNVAPWAAMALSAHAQKQHHGDQMKQWEHSQAEKERMREEGGFNIKPRKIRKAKYRSNPDYTIGKEGASDQPMYIREEGGDAPEYARGGTISGKREIPHAVLGSYNKGTLIKGPGNGQADKIRTRVPEGSYIIDASTVANFGDGSSESGGKVLKECEALIRKRSATRKPMKSGGMVDVFLSNDEYKFDPETVTLLGKGSNQQGSRILKTMVKNLRKDKNRLGDRLPPKAKHPFQYMKG